jgi:hypothetical protein
MLPCPSPSTTIKKKRKEKHLEDNNIRKQLLLYLECINYYRQKKKYSKSGVEMSALHLKPNLIR